MMRPLFQVWTGSLSPLTYGFTWCRTGTFSTERCSQTPATPASDERGMPLRVPVHKVPTNVAGQDMNQTNCDLMRVEMVSLQEYPFEGMFLLKNSKIPWSPIFHVSNLPNTKSLACLDAGSGTRYMSPILRNCDISCDCDWFRFLTGNCARKQECNNS